jgi:hypothetical protein
LSAAIFSLKAVGLRGKRFVTDRKLPLLRFGSGRKTDYPVLLAELRSPLWTTESIIEAGLQQGKVQNLRRACGKLNFVVVPAGAIFSFWKQIGKATRSAGYVEGRELRQGCLIPSVGGGLCQLSNALYATRTLRSCRVRPQSRVVMRPCSGIMWTSASGRNRTFSLPALFLATSWCSPSGDAALSRFFPW